MSTVLNTQFNTHHMQCRVIQAYKNHCRTITESLSLLYQPNLTVSGKSRFKSKIYSFSNK